MKTFDASLFAAALAVLLTPPFLLPTQGQFVIDPYRFAAAGPSYIVDEDFEGTGIPSGWTNQALTPNYDATFQVSFSGGGEYVDIDGSAQSRVDFSGQSEVWAAGRLFVDTSGLPASLTSYVGLRDSSGQPGVVLRLSTSAAAIFGNGSDQTTSSTFTPATGTNYYWILHYTGNGTCELKISTTTSFGTVPTDSATQFSASFTDTNNYTISRLDFRGHGVNSNTHFFDDVFVDDEEITNPW